MATRDDPTRVSPPPGHSQSDPGLVVLRRLDDTEVARCTVRGAAWEEILRAAEEGEGEIDER